MTKESSSIRGGDVPDFPKQQCIFSEIGEIDISEQDIWDYEPNVLCNLLVDHTMSEKARKESNDPSKIVNIFWATNDYAGVLKDGDGNILKEGFQYNDEIKPENIIGRHQRVVMPRVLKDRQRQSQRTKAKAEVFTPSWVCNAQNNLVDAAWFGHPDVFNHEVVDNKGQHTWIPTEGKIQFPADSKKTWKKYVSENRMEITCGEAPYLVSRYDTTTGEYIPVSRRIGLLDRKMRVINENVTTETEWYSMAEKAFKHTYGYEWQGDSLLLAREALLFTYIEYYIDKFNAKEEDGRYITATGELNVPDKSHLINVSRWISWNIWQMDGIKMVVPESCHDTQINVKSQYNDLYDELNNATTPKTIRIPCPGCAKNDVNSHNGVYCIIRDWTKSKPLDWKPRVGEDPHSQPWQKIQYKELRYDCNRNDEAEYDD